jgi:hypothetical protein
VGPIGHGVFTTLRYSANSRFPDDADAFRFFDRHLKGKTNGVEADKPVYEGTTIANAFNYSIGWSGPTAGPGPITLGLYANSTVTSTKLAVFQCPSDRDLPFTWPAPFNTSLPNDTRGNYAANWGNTQWDQGLFTTNFSAPGNAGLPLPNTTLPMPFPFFPSAISFASVTDGLSNTMLISEILKGSGGDIRGDLWASLPGANAFTTRFTPNGFIDYLSGRSDRKRPDDVSHLPDKAFACRTAATNSWR